jgi:type VI secretion system (T6SS) VasI/EvfG family protein
MIPIIGVMIGLYILTRMVELIASSQKPLLRILGAVTAAGSTVGILLLIGTGTSLSDVNFRSSPTATSSATLSSLIDTAPSAADLHATWGVSESTNPLDDSPTVILRLPAASGRSRMGEAPALVLRCSRKKTDAYINWADFLGSDEATVTTRVGKGRAETGSWTLSTDNTATFYPSGAVSFIKSLMRVDTLVASTTPYNESPVTAIFVVTGLAEKVGPLQKACGWT